MSIESNKLQAELNRKKYRIPPSIKLIDRVIKKLKITDAEFERVFGLHRSSIGHARMGIRKIPAHSWHIFYEKITIKITPRSFTKRKKVENKSTINSTTNLKLPDVSKNPADTPDSLLDSLIKRQSPK